MLDKDIPYESVLDQLNDGVLLTDDEAVINYWNRGAERITGLARDSVDGLVYGPDFLPHLDREGSPVFNGESPVQRCLREGRTLEQEAYISHDSGAPVPVLARVSPIINTRNEVIGAIEVFSDNTSKVAALRRIEELEELALLCPVTEAGNRRYTEITLQNAFEELRRYHWKFGVLFTDIDHFKDVNDTYGHHTGDEILRMVAHALRASLRSFDFVGRWGGEEFVVILPNINDDVLASVAERCRVAVEVSRYQHEGRQIGVTVSVGAALAQRDESAEDLLARVDRLMYRSKQGGRNLVTTDV